MLNRAFGALGGLAGASFVGCLVAALTNGTSPLWIATAVSAVVAVVLGIAWYISHEDPPSAPPIQADHQSVVAGGEIKADHGSSQILHSYNTTIAPSPSSIAPTVHLQIHERCCWLTVTNNDTAEPFIVEVSRFTAAGGAVRPKWYGGGDEERMLRRGESAQTKIMCVEPNLVRPAPVMSIVDKTVWEYQQPLYEKRREQGYRLVRFYGAADRDVRANVNAAGTFYVKVISHRHAAIEQGYSYAVTQNNRLVIPYSQEAIAEDNAAYATEQIEALRKLRELAAQFSDQDSEVNS